jgi:CHAT domain-containing protein
MLMTCFACGVKNRLSQERLNQRPVCGRCRQLLFAGDLVEMLQGAPDEESRHTIFVKLAQDQPALVSQVQDVVQEGEYLVVPCVMCGAKNRLAPRRLHQRPVCGRCRERLCSNAIVSLLQVVLEHPELQVQVSQGNVPADLQAESIPPHQPTPEALLKTQAQWERGTELLSAYIEAPSAEKIPQLHEAIACYDSVLAILTREAFPQDWAMTHNNRGFAYANLPTGDRDANLQMAIAAYDQALLVYTREAFPQNWAMTLHNRARAYAKLPTGDRRANLQQAIAGYDQALLVYTEMDFPVERLRTLRNLSRLYYEDERWLETLVACDEGIRVAEGLRAEALTAVERTRVLSDNVALVDRAVHCAVELGQYAQALVYAERSKTRNLMDTLSRRDLRPQHVDDATWETYQAGISREHTLEQHLASNNLLDSTSIECAQGLRADLAQVRTDLDHLEVQFRLADPEYLPTAPPLAFADLQDLVRQADAILVAFHVTETGTFVFLLSGDDPGLSAEQVIRLPAFTTAALHALLVRFEGGAAVDGWLVRYYQWRAQRRDRTRHQAWLDCLEQVTKDLYTRLLRPVIERLQSRYPDARRLLVVPNKEINLLPLHAAHSGHNGQSRAWLDDYDILYTPSCAVFQRCLHRERTRSERDTLVAVQNPTGDLPFADWEVDEAAAYFSRRHLLSGAQATRAQVISLLDRGHEVLLSCHGTYALNDVMASHLVLYGDDRLMLSDILHLDLSHAWLIVLSACETAVSDYRDRVDEVQGLHTAFLIAGAPTVVASQWSVSDLSTALLMQRLHVNLYAEGMDKAGALREAQLWLREISVAEAERLLDEKRAALERMQAAERMGLMDVAVAGFALDDLAAASGGKPFAHPYWWAGFQCVGAGWRPTQDDHG